MAYRGKAQPWRTDAMRMPSRFARHWLSAQQDRDRIGGALLARSANPGGIDTVPAGRAITLH